MGAQGTRVRFRGAGAVPGLGELKDSFREWVPAIKEIWTSIEQLEELSAAEKKIRGMVPTREEYAAILRTSWAGYRNRYVARLAQFLGENLKARDPLSRGERLDFLVRPLIPLEAFEEALALLPAEAFSEVPDTEKSKELAKIQKQRKKLETRISELRCPPYLQLRGGELRDIREEFVESWRSKQREAREGVDPQGLDLRDASEDMRWAYAELHIADYISPRGMLGATRG